jgi:hypothetical protein
MRTLPAPIIAVLLGLAGCATDVVEVRKSWYGATYEDVARAWGKPTASTTFPDGRQEHVWLTETPSHSGSSIGVGFGIFRGGGDVSVGAGTGVSVPVGGPSAPHRCERRMVFRDNAVVDQVWNGDPGYCNIYRRP